MGKLSESSGCEGRRRLPDAVQLHLENEPLPHLEVQKQARKKIQKQRALGATRGAKRLKKGKGQIESPPSYSKFIQAKLG